MLYAAELHRYKHTLSSIIEDAELAVEFNLMLQKPFPEILKPEKSDCKKVQETKPLNFVEKEHRYCKYS